MAEYLIGSCRCLLTFHCIIIAEEDAVMFTFVLQMLTFFEWQNLYVVIPMKSFIISKILNEIIREREKDREEDRQTETKRQRETETETERQRDRDIERQRQREGERERAAKSCSKKQLF